LKNNGQHLVAREGWLPVGIVLILSFLGKIYLGWVAFIILFIFFLALCYIFRDPKRTIPSAPLAVVSPCAGEIVAVEKVTDPWLNRPAIRCRIRMSIWNVHILRSPIEGKVMDQWYSDGKEQGVKKRYSYWIKTDESDDVILSLALGRGALLAKMGIHCGERTGQGQNSGFLYFSGLIDVLVPENARIEIKEGDYVLSGQSVLAQFIHASG